MKLQYFRRWRRAWLAGLFVVVAGLFNLSPALTVAKAGTTSTEVIVHYYRFAGDYSGWDLWMWPQGGNGNSYEFTSSDSYGKVADAMIPGSPSEVGIIVRKNDWSQKDVDSDRYISVTNGKAEVWLVQGNPTIFMSESAAEKAAQPAPQNAFLDGTNQVLVKLNTTAHLAADQFTLTDNTTGQTIPITGVANANAAAVVNAHVVGSFQHLLAANNPDWNPADELTKMKEINPDLYQFSATLPAGSYQYKVALNGTWDVSYPGNNVSITVPTGGATVTFSYIPSTHQVVDSMNDPTATLSDGLTTDLATLTLGTQPDVTHTLTLTWNKSNAISVIPRNVLDSTKYTYTGNDLGNTYTPSDTKFRVWAPTASNMNLQLFDTADAAVTRTVPMQPSDNGTWVADVQGNLQNWYYLYQVTIDGTTQTAVDPYATDIAPNGTRGMIVNLDDTNPPGWNADKHVAPNTPEDSVIYEAHVRDFSIDSNSGMTNKGEYLAFTEQGTKGPNDVATGIDSLKELGITDVQVQPVEEFASIDELGSKGQYNWGYDPRNYDVPEGAYATTPTGTSRITQYKQMVQSLHKAGIGVIMDVVYNHTFATKISDFDKLVPEYYYRTDSAGNYTNGSGVGNELATERPMVRKFVLDSTKFWVQQYHVDGFRFDLMALLGTNTMSAVSEELHQIDPSILLYGEPWTGGTSGINGDTLLTKGQQQGLGVGVFNDNIRNALDGNVFDKTAQGFATGATDQVGAIENGIVGSIPYSSTIHDFAASPSETINYVTSHDNMTLWDKIAASNPTDSETDRIHMDELAQAVVFTSQGIPFMQGGAEMLRTKGGNDNSYNAGDAVNEFDWSRKAQYLNVFNYYAGLIHMRLDHPAFRMTTADDIQQHLQFLESPNNTIEYELKDNTNDTWKNIVVIFNPNKSNESFTLPAGKWTVVATQDKAGENALGHAEGTVNVPGITTEILYQTQNVQ